MSRYVAQIWVTVEAEDLEEAIGMAHAVSSNVEELSYVVTTFIGDDYEVEINEYGDTKTVSEVDWEDLLPSQ